MYEYNFTNLQTTVTNNYTFLYQCITLEPY